jgi:hypothetical protein
MYPSMYPKLYNHPASHVIHGTLESPSGTKIKKGLA